MEYSMIFAYQSVNTRGCRIIDFATEEWIGIAKRYCRKYKWIVAQLNFMQIQLQLGQYLKKVYFYLKTCWLIKKGGNVHIGLPTVGYQKSECDQGPSEFHKVVLEDDNQIQSAYCSAV